MTKTSEYLKKLEDTKSQFSKALVGDNHDDFEAASKFLSKLEEKIKKIKDFLSKPTK